MEEQTTTAQVDTNAVTEQAEQTTAAEQTEQATTTTTEQETGQEQVETATKTEETADLLADYKPTLPEGFELDEKAMEAALPIMKELGLSTEQADKLIGLHAQTVQSTAAKVVEDINATCQKNYDDVFAEIKKDKALGGRDFDKNMGQVNALLTKYGDKNTPEQLHTALTALAGFDKEAVKPFFSALAKMARDAADDSTILGIPRQANSSNPYPDLPQDTKKY